MGKASRDKGKRGERATAKEIREALGPGVVVRRGNQTREGRDEPDVVVEGMPVWIEVKSWGHRPSWNEMVGALIQAEDAIRDSATPGHTPIAVIREDRRKPMAVMRANLCGSRRAVMLQWVDVLAWLRAEGVD